jgi:hypothetical protein
MRPINFFRTMAVAGAVLLAPSMLSAQVAHKPLSFAVFGGASVPTGDASDAFNTGYTLGGAMDMRNSSMLGLRAEASYSSMSVKVPGVTDNTTDIGANLNAVVWTSKRPGALSPYLTGGASYAHYNFGEGTDAQNKWGFNAGAGIDFSMGRIPARIDARYVQISMENSVQMKTVPLTFGIRF